MENTQDFLDNTSYVEPIQEPTENSSPQPKLNKKAYLLGTIIAIVILICIGIGAFFIVKNSPENATIDALNNLANAEKVALDGNISISPDYSLIGVDTIDINFGTKIIDSNNKTDVSIKIAFTDGSSTDTINIGEAALKSGIFYLQVSNITNLYQNYLREIISENLINNFTLQAQSRVFKECYQSDHSDHQKCIDSGNDNIDSETTQQQMAEKAEEFLDKIDNIVYSIEGSWYEFSIEDILNSELVTESIPNIASYRQGIKSTYNCTINAINNFSDYSENLSNYYRQHPFFTFDLSVHDNYYNLGYKPQVLADFIDNINEVDIFNAIKGCFGVNYNRPYEITAKDIESNLEYLPNIAIRYDGFLNHHLTDIKIDKKMLDHGPHLESHISFSYPDNLEVSTPTEYRPIMDLIQEIYENIILEIQSLYY